MDDFKLVISRRGLAAGAAATAILALDRDAFARPNEAAFAKSSRKGARALTNAKMKDGTTIYYKDWGTGPVITFSHGWPLSGDAWDAQMMFFSERGFRVIAHDRRGHGRSDQTATGNTMDTYGDDLATLLETLDIKGATMIGHSTGGGEVTRFVGRHGTARVSKAALISAVPPHLGRSPENSQGAPIAVFDGLRSGLLADRPAFYRDLAMPFFGYNRPGKKVSQGQIDDFWRQSMMGGVRNHYESIKAFSETDFSSDLKKMNVPTLLLHGDDDQIVPIDLASRRSIKLLPHGTLKEIHGAPHGLCVTHANEVNEILMTFMKGSS